jgi:hypothetical protein
MAVYWLIDPFDGRPKTEANRMTQPLQRIEI